MYRTIWSPLAHILVDYRNMRRALIRKEYADNWNTQSKMICSYTSSDSIYKVSEGEGYSQTAVQLATERINTQTNAPIPVQTR